MERITEIELLKEIFVNPEPLIIYVVLINICENIVKNNQKP
jgi:hypothetical protein